MSADPLRYEKRDDGIAVVTLDRPEKLNALTGSMLDRLSETVDEIAADPEVRVFLLRGAPRPDGRPCFSAGVDVKAVMEGDSVGEEQGLALTNKIDDLLKPSIAVIDGVCTTGGAEIALACDFRLVGRQARISDWHLKKLGTGLGAWGASTRWARECGVTNAKQMLLTGREIDGDEALRMGLVNRSCAPGDALATAHALAAELAALPQRCMRSDLRSTKDQWSLSMPEALLHETLLGRETIASGETREGATRFAQGAGRHGAKA